mgnify:CR=1 FL=1
MENILDDLKNLLTEVKNQFQRGGIIATTSHSLALSEEMAEKLQNIIKKYELQ